MSLREIVDQCNDLRINFNDIRIAPHGLVTRGGQGERDLAFVVSSPNEDPASASRPLAVKRMHLDGGNNTTRSFTGFTHEVGLLKRVSHPNIVKLAGFVEAEGDGIAWLVLPWERNGNLHEFIASADWEIPECISLIRDVAEGIAYLHAQRPPICHGDLKAENILINVDCRALITDFGSARLLELNAPSSADAEPGAGGDDGSESDNDCPDPLTVEFSRSSGSLVLTGPEYSLRWAAPEVLVDENLGLPSDIWAFGWICWEVLTKDVPFTQVQHTGSIVSRIVTGRLPAIEDDTQQPQVLALCDLMMNCWKQTPEERPSASQCQENLQGMTSTQPSPTLRGSNREVRSTALLLKLGEMHWAQGNIESAMHSYREALDLARRTQDLKVIGAGLLGLADVFRRMSRTSDAEEHTSEALKIFNHIGNDWGVARSYLGLARVQHMLSKHFEAEQHLSKALEVYARIQDQSGLVMALEELGDVCQAQLKFPEAIKYLFHTVEVYKGVGNQVGQGNTLIRLGNIYRVLSRYKEADLLFREALNVFTRVGNLEGRGNALFGLANLRSMQSSVSEAESLYSEAIQIYEQLGDKVGETCALNGLGEACRARSRFHEAEAAFSRALEISTRIGNELEKGKATIGLGKTYRVQSKYAEAQNAFSSALEVYRRIGDDVGRVNALNGLGEASLGSLKYSEANASFSEALAVSDSLNYELGRGNALLGLGHTNRAQEMYPAAEAFFVRALEVYTRIENVTGKAHSLHELGRTYVVQNKYPQAEMCLSEAMEYFRRSGQGIPTAGTLISLGQISMALQDTRAAEERWIEARKLFSSIGHTEGEIAAEKFLAQIFQMRNASRGCRFHIILAFTCFGVALVAWSATLREWLYTLWLPFRRIADK
ncbi:hypothetical protein M407DRAFT_20511 [Tulasnella calospora MUT 4182]|uniref:Protein kinase domain-containing protein n=1 Tax=Tulasnella calospora MUT 4182 TaxID=1051891 RepID=A0A0C3QPZ4_9AGAM|nr:hypothetical protein M407DRAFT_20511 [Tulasnella calospora MUT 4182]